MPCSVHAVNDVIPFIDKMCQSDQWIEEFGQANAGCTWCAHESQTDWRRYFGKLCHEHVLSDGFCYKLEIIFGIEPVSLTRNASALTSSLLLHHVVMLSIA